MNIGERLLVAVMPVDVDVPVDTRYGLLVAVMLGDSTGVAGMNMAEADIAVPVVMVLLLDIAVPVVVAMADMPVDVVDMGERLLVATVPVDVVGVDMLVVNIDNPLFCGGFGMPSSMLILGVWHYHYAVTLVFRWEVPVEYLHNLSPQ